MLTRAQTTVIILVAGLALAAQLFLQQGLQPSPTWVHYLTPIVSAVLIALWAFETLAWHWPIVRMLGGSRPDLRGTWKGTIVSFWVDPQTNQRVAPIEAFMVVRQTFSTLSLRLLTAESSSESLTADVLRAPDGTCQVSWVYRNDPRMTVRHRSEIHYGTGSLRIVGDDDPTGLEGHYWTDRDISGEMHFTSRAPAVADSFAAARATLASDT